MVAAFVLAAAFVLFVDEEEAGFADADTSFAKDSGSFGGDFGESVRNHRRVLTVTFCVLRWRPFTTFLFSLIFVLPHGCRACALQCRYCGRHCHSCCFFFDFVLC